MAFYLRPNALLNHTSLSDPRIFFSNFLELKLNIMKIILRAYKNEI